MSSLVSEEEGPAKVSEEYSDTEEGEEGRTTSSLTSDSSSEPWSLSSSDYSPSPPSDSEFPSSSDASLSSLWEPWSSSSPDSSSNCSSSSSDP